MAWQVFHLEQHVKLIIYEFENLKSDNKDKYQGNVSHT